MKKIILIALCLLPLINIFPDIKSAMYGNIEGQVIDRATQQPLKMVNIIVIGTSIGASTDETGHFIIKHLTVGHHRLKAMMMGYKSQIITEVQVAAGRVTKIEFKLEETVVKLNSGIVVTSDYFQQDAERPISLKSLSPREIRNSAGTAEDIYMILKSMPGIASMGGPNANMIVRGGAPDENLTILDGMEIYSPIHFSQPNMSMGIISIIHPSLLKSVDLMTGGFSAEYGNKLSSVFKMNIKEGHRSEWTQDYSLNMAGFGALIDGPISKNTSMILSVRRGFFDIITNMMDRPVAPRYWDGVAKLTHRIAANHKLDLTAFYFRDNLTKDGIVKDPPHSMRKEYYHIEKEIIGSAIGLNWTWMTSHDGFLKTTVSYTGNRWNSESGSEAVPDMDTEDITEEQLLIKTVFTNNLGRQFSLKTGISMRGIDPQHIVSMTPDTMITGLINPAIHIAFRPDRQYRAAGFMQTTWKASPLFTMSGGLRGDYYDFTDELKISPRLSLHWQLEERLAFNAAWGNYYQTPNAFQVSRDIRNISLQSRQAEHAIIGLEYLIAPDTKLTLEAYHKEMNDLFVSSDTTNLITNSGKGSSDGIELYIQKKMSDRWVGSLSYTLSKSKRQDGAKLPEYNYEFDQTHNLTAIIGFAPNNNWRFGMKIQYATGMPYTPVLGMAHQNGVNIALKGPKNSERYPDIFRADLRIDRHFHFAGWTLTAYVDIWNITNRDNILFYNYEIAENKVKLNPSYDFKLLPTLGLTAQF
ncbi:TonB-dependent receptor [bacterium]|nr:TonB-dependent receptor [bacterium]